jgi:hypothetical protein
LTSETKMKIKLEIQLDTDEQTDLDLVDDLMDELANFREILEAKQQNLNKRIANTNRKPKAKS